MYEIITDTSANLDVALLRQQGIGVIPFSFYIDGQETRCTDTEQFDAKAFYDGMRRGTPVTTSQLTPQRYLDCFAPLLAAGRDILFVGMSSGISGSYASARMAAAQLQEEFPQRKLRLVDTLSASLGEGLQVLKAAEYRTAGIDLDTAADRLLEERHRMCQVFTVEDLRYLRRSGRISNLKAAVGTVLQIKPMLKGDPQGQIVCFAQVRGRKKSIEVLAEQYDRYIEDAENETVAIVHADCPQEAAYLAGQIRENVRITRLNEVFTCHTGKGAVALIYPGTLRTHPPV